MFCENSMLQLEKVIWKGVEYEKFVEKEFISIFN